jgi:hypothetical protein
MIFIHCAGNGDIYTTDTKSGEVIEFASYEAAAAAAALQSAQSADITHGVAWFSERDAADFYFYDFIWGDALESITVPVGAYGQLITFHKPARQLVRPCGAY